MTAETASLTNHPAPHRDRVSPLRALFGLLGGPGAWFAQLCAGYAMASWPCFPREEHRILPEAGYAWTWAAIVVISVVAIGISIAAFAVSRAYLRRGCRVKAMGVINICWMSAAGGLASWLFGEWCSAPLSLLATAMTLVAFFVLPRCAG